MPETTARPMFCKACGGAIYGPVTQWVTSGQHAEGPYHPDCSPLARSVNDPSAGAAPLVESPGAGPASDDEIFQDDSAPFLRRIAESEEARFTDAETGLFIPNGIPAKLYRVAAEYERLKSVVASQDAELGRLRAERGKLRNALCVVLDHIELGEAGVLEADIDWLTKLVESFSAASSPSSEGT